MFVAQGPVDEGSVDVGATEHVAVLGACFLDPFAFDCAVGGHWFDAHLFGAAEGLQDLNLLGGQLADGATPGGGVGGDGAMGVEEDDAGVLAPVGLAQVEVVEGLWGVGAIGVRG